MKFGKICSPNMDISKNELFYIRLFRILIFLQWDQPKINQSYSPLKKKAI